MEPIELLRVLRRRWRVLTACALIAVTAALVAGPAGGTSAPSHRKYKATSTLLANALKHNSQMSLAQDALLLKIGVVPRKAATALGFSGNPARLVSQMTQAIDLKVGSITLTTTQPTANQALAVVNTFAEQLVAYLADVSRANFNSQAVTALQNEQTLENQLVPINTRLQTDPTNVIDLARRDAVTTQFRLAAKTYSSLLNTGAEPARYRLIESTNAVAVVKSSKFSVNSLGGRPTRAALALLIGLLIGAGLAMLLDRFDLRVRTKEDAEEAFGLPVVSEIPALWYPTRRRREVITAVRPISPYAEVHRILRHSLLFAHMSPWMAENGHGNGNGNGNGNGYANGNGHANGNGIGKGRQVIVVTSAGSAEGKTTTVANLAASFAESGQSVLVMSCDFHGPRIQEMLGAGDAPGIANVLHGGADAPSLAEVTVETSIPGVWLAPSGDGIDNPPELASSVGALMTAARELADVVIIDTPALLSVSAASELLPAADVAVIVARSARTTREAAIRVHERLEFLGAPVLGIVLVGPQIPSVSREYSGYSRPPGGWRKRRKIMRKRGIQIGARAETLAPTKGTVPTGSPRSIQPGRGTAITVDPAPARAPRGTEGPETDIREPAPDAGISQHDPDVPEYVAPVASVDDLSPRPRWRRRESRRDE